MTGRDRSWLTTSNSGAAKRDSAFSTVALSRCAGVESCMVVFRSAAVRNMNHDPATGRLDHITSTDESSVGRCSGSISV